MARVSSRNLASTPVLFAVVVSAETLPSAHSVCRGSARRAMAYLSDWSKTQLYLPRCKGESQPIYSRTVTEMDVDDKMLDVEAPFCYLGDIR